MMLDMTKSKVATTKKGRPTVKVRSSIFKGRIMAGIPVIKRILQTLDPKIPPRAISYFFLAAALIETISSGKEVPIAKTDMAIKELEIFSIAEISRTDSTA